MRKKTAIWSAVIVAVVAAIASVAILFVQGESGPDAGEIQRIVAAANYCASDAECVVTGASCPFSTELVNVKELPKINELYHRYFSVERRGCVINEIETRDFTRITCQQGRCEAALKGGARREEAPAGERKPAPLQSRK